MDTLIAEDLVLLLLDDESGHFRDAAFLEVAIGGAVLAELALTGAVEVVAPARRFHAAKIGVADVPAPGDPVLAEGLALIAERSRSAQSLVERLGRHRRSQLLHRLRERGVLAERHERVAGLIPRTSWPTADATHEAAVRRRVAAALVRDEEPDARTAVLVALLSAMDAAHRVIDREGRSAADIRRRAKAIAEGNWSAGAVRDVIAAAIAAAVAAVSATIAASSG